MAVMRLGQLEFLNCLPVYFALEEKLLGFNGSLKKGSPNFLNKLLAENKLDVTPVSSIEYARNCERYLILPDLCISADGRVASVLLFSRKPVTELEGSKIAVTGKTATSAVMLRILLEHYYQVKANFFTLQQNIHEALQEQDALLLIGDDALQVHQAIRGKNPGIIVTDLGDAWKRFTGEKMVYAVWAVRRDFAYKHPQQVSYINSLLSDSKKTGLANIQAVVKKAHEKTGLPDNVLEDYYKIILYDFDRQHRKALCVFFDYAYKSGIIKERVGLRIWGEVNEGCQLPS